MTPNVVLSHRIITGLRLAPGLGRLVTSSTRVALSSICSPQFWHAHQQKRPSCPAVNDEYKTHRSAAVTLEEKNLLNSSLSHPIMEDGEMMNSKEYLMVAFSNLSPSFGQMEMRLTS